MSYPIPPSLMTPDKSSPIPPKNEIKETPDGSRKSMGSTENVHSISSFLKKSKRPKKSSIDCPLGMGEILVTTELTVTSEPNPYYFADQERQTRYQDTLDSTDNSFVPMDPSTSRTWSITGGPYVGHMPDRSQWVTSNGPGPSEGESSVTTLSQESTKEWGLYEDSNGDLSNLSIYSVFHPTTPPSKNCSEKPLKNNDKVIPVVEKIPATSSSKLTSRGSDGRLGTYAPEMGSGQDMVPLGRSQPKVVAKLVAVGEQNDNNHDDQRRNKNESSMYPTVRVPSQDTIPPRRFQPGAMTELAAVAESNNENDSFQRTTNECEMYAPVRSFNQDTTLPVRSQLSWMTVFAADDEHNCNDDDFRRRNTKEGGVYIPLRGARRESYVYGPSLSAFQSECPYVRRPIQHDTSFDSPTTWLPIASERLNKQADIFTDEPMLTPALYKNHQTRISTAKSAQDDGRKNEHSNLDYDSMLGPFSGHTDMSYTEMPSTNGGYKTRTLVARSARNDERNCNEESKNESRSVEYRTMLPSPLENTSRPSGHNEYQARPSIAKSAWNEESKNEQSGIPSRRTKETSASEEYQTGALTELEILLNDIKKKPPFQKYQTLKSAGGNERKNERNHNEDALKNNDQGAAKNEHKDASMLTVSSEDVERTSAHRTITGSDQQYNGRAPSRNINQRTFVSRSGLPKPITKSSLGSQLNNAQLATPPLSYSRVPSPIVDTSRTSSSAGRPILRKIPSVDASRPGSSIGQSVLRQSPSVDVPRHGSSIGQSFPRKSPSIDAFRPGSSIGQSYPSKSPSIDGFRPGSSVGRPALRKSPSVDPSRLGSSVGRPALRKSPSIDVSRPGSSVGRPALRKSPSIDASRLGSAIGRSAVRSGRGNDGHEKATRPKLTSSLYRQPVLEEYQFSSSTSRSALKNGPKGEQQTDIRDFIERTPPLRYSQNKTTPPLRYSQNKATPPLSYTESQATPRLRYSKNKLTPTVGYGRYMPASSTKSGGENKKDKDKDKHRDKDGLGINLDGSGDYERHTQSALSPKNIDPEVEIRKQLHQLLHSSVSLPWNMGNRKRSDSSSHTRGGPSATMADGGAAAPTSPSTSTSTFPLPLGPDGVIDNDLLISHLLTDQYRENAKSAARATSHLSSTARRSLSTATTPQPASLTIPPIDSPSPSLSLSLSLSQRRRVPPEIPHQTRPLYLRAGFGESSNIQTLSVDGGATKVALESYTIPNTPRGLRLPPGSPVPLVGSGYGHIIYSYPASASPKPSQERARRANEVPRLDSVLYFSVLEREAIAKLVEAASSCKPCDGGHENCTDCLNLKYSIIETQIMPTTMAPEERQKVIQNNRSLRTIKTELENLLGNGAVDDATFETIMAALPNESSPNATSSASSVSRPSATSTPPTAALGNLSLNNAAPPPVSTPSLPSRAPSAAEPPRELCRATAIYRYVAQDAGDCQFNSGDEIAVYEYTNGDWWKGKNLSTGQEGLFPVNYVQPREQPPSYGYNNDKAPAYNGYGGGYPGQYQQGPPPPGPSNPYNAAVPPMAMAQQPADPGKPSTLKKIGGKLGNAAIFGAGATLGSDMVNAIL